MPYQAVPAERIPLSDVRLGPPGCPVAMTGRPRAGSSESAELEIVLATERLLEHTPLQTLRVADILTEAGLSRRTFYVYFASKYDAAAAMAERSLNDVFAEAQTWIADHGEDHRVALRQMLHGTAAACEKHAAAYRTMVEHWPLVPELERIWLRNIGRFADAFAHRITRDRAAGLAPPGQDPSTLATTLVWSSERLFYIGARGLDPRLPTMQDVVDALYEVWHRAVYLDGQAPPAP